MPAWVLDTLLLIQLPANTPRKTTDDSSTFVSAIHFWDWNGLPDSQFWPGKPWLLSIFGKQTNGLISPLLASTNKIHYKKKMCSIALHIAIRNMAEFEIPATSQLRIRSGFWCLPSISWVFETVTQVVTSCCDRTAVILEVFLQHCKINSSFFSKFPCFVVSKWLISCILPACLVVKYWIKSFSVAFFLHVLLGFLHQQHVMRFNYFHEYEL